MKKIICTLILGLVALPAFSQNITCLDKLLPVSRFSGLHQLSKEECSKCENFDVEGVKIAFHTLINSKYLCSPNEVTIKVGPVCQQIISGLSQSQVCFIFSNVGHFTISRDHALNFNFIFTRDTLFTPEGQEDPDFRDPEL